MVNKKGLKAVGYVRVSTEEQAKEGISLDAQEARVEAFCEAKDWKLLRIYRDEGISGKDLNRPGVQALIRDLKSNGVDVVVTVKLDRLTRSIRDLGALIEDLFEGVALACIEEGLDSATNGGELVINLLGSVAQWERKAIGERTKAALDYKRSQGEWCGRIPFGFKLEGKKLVEDPAQMKIILSMKRMHQRGQSVRTIAGKFSLGKSTVHRIVTTDLRFLKACQTISTD